MTLGRFITLLSEMPPDASCKFDFCRLTPTTLHSYRGYYERLALGFSEGGEKTVGTLLAECKAAVGATLTGWKGGEYRMDGATLLHVANAGDTSETQIIRLSETAYSGVVIETARVED